VEAKLVEHALKCDY